MIRDILVVVDSIDENAGSGAKANIAFISSLNEAGYDVTVFHYSHKEIVIKNANCYQIKEINVSLLYLLGRIIRIINRKTKHNLNEDIERYVGFSFTFFNDSNSIEKSIKRLNLSKFDLVITLSQGASFRPHHALLKIPRLHSKWLAYIHDPYPFHLYPRPYQFFKKSFLIKEKFFENMNQKAAYFGFPSQLLMEWMAYTFPNMKSKGMVIPHQINKQVTIPIESPTVSIDPNEFNIIHSGNLTHARSPEGLIKGFLAFLKSNPLAKSHSKLLLIGPSDYSLDMLNEFAGSSSRIVFHNNSIPFNEAQQLQEETSVNVIIEASSSISPFLPGKFPHCVSANKPILLLSPYYSECKRLLGDDYPYWCENQNSSCIAKAISSLYVLWEENKNNFKLNRPDLVEYCSSSYMKNALSKTL